MKPDEHGWIPGPEIVIAGCGNPVFADDGFGPAVIRVLSFLVLPQTVKPIDAGICGPDLIFPFLDPAITRTLIIIDTLDSRSVPGTVILLQPETLRETALTDAIPGGIASSIQSLPPGITTYLIGCQPGEISYPFMRIGLSDPVRMAIPRTVEMVMDILAECTGDIQEIVCPGVPRYKSLGSGISG